MKETFKIGRQTFRVKNPLAIVYVLSIDGRAEFGVVRAGYYGDTPDGYKVVIEILSEDPNLGDLRFGVPKKVSKTYPTLIEAIDAERERMKAKIDAGYKRLSEMERYLDSINERFPPWATK